MIIGIDSRFALKNRRGIGNYTLNLIQALTKIDKENHYILYTDSLDVDKVLPQNTNFCTKPLTPKNYLLWEQLALPKQAIKDSVDLLHCTANTAPASLNKNIKLIVTVHDVIYLKKRSLLAESKVIYQKLGRIYRSIVVSNTIKNASKVIAVSNYSKKDILHHFPNLNKNYIETTYEAADSVFSLLETNTVIETVKNNFGIDNKYLLTLGGTDPRKNTKLVIQAFANLKHQDKIDEKLIIVGIPNWNKSQFYELVYSLNLENEVLFTGFVTQEELICLYNSASIFLYPSLYEGFGIPPLEAMACGTPVITSNTTSIPEVVGDAALQINPTNQEELEKTVHQLLFDNALRNDLIQRGLIRSKQFSWHRMAEETLDIYKSVIKNGNN